MHTYMSFTLASVQSVTLSDGRVIKFDECLTKTLKPKQVFGFIKQGASVETKVSLSAFVFENSVRRRIFQDKGIAPRAVERYAEKVGCLKGAAADVLFWTGYLFAQGLEYMELPLELPYKPKALELEPTRDGKLGRPATGKNVPKEFTLPDSVVRQLKDYGPKPAKFLSLVFDSYQNNGARLGCGDVYGETKKIQLALTDDQYKLLGDISGHYGTTLSQSLMKVYQGSKYPIR